LGTLLNGKEKKLFDSINLEMMTLAGAQRVCKDILLWAFQTPTTSTHKDALYDEPNSKASYKSYSVKIFFERPITETSATDEGLEQSFSGRAWFSRKDLELAKVAKDYKGNHVKEGDTFELFHKGNRIFYEIINVDREGIVNDSDVFTQYTVDFVRRQHFIPERKLADGI
jgi:hypothetical protein